jgi:hypothetical protein
MYKSHFDKNELSLVQFPSKVPGALIFIWSDFVDSEGWGSHDPDPDILLSAFHFSLSSKGILGTNEVANSCVLRNVVLGSEVSGSVKRDKAAITSADFLSSRCCSMVGIVIEITPGAYSSSSSFSSSENGSSSSCSESDSPDCRVLSR